MSVGPTNRPPVTAVIPTVVAQALEDRELPPVARLAMWYLSRRLDFLEFRDVKTESLATEMGIKATTAGQALHLLVARGYLDESGRRKPRAFRLMWSRRTSTARAA